MLFNQETPRNAYLYTFASARSTRFRESGIQNHELAHLACQVIKLAVILPVIYLFTSQPHERRLVNEIRFRTTGPGGSTSNHLFQLARSHPVVPSGMWGIFVCGQTPGSASLLQEPMPRGVIVDLIKLLSSFVTRAVPGK